MVRQLRNGRREVTTHHRGKRMFRFLRTGKSSHLSGETGVLVGTGVAFEIPKGYHMKLFMRSSYGAHRKLRLSNCVGICDSSYRGEVKGLFDNIGDLPEIIEKGERFMQGLIEKNVEIEFKEVDTLTETQRGSGGFGSTGR